MRGRKARKRVTTSQRCKLRRAVNAGGGCDRTLSGSREEQAEERWRRFLVSEQERLLRKSDIGAASRTRRTRAAMSMARRGQGERISMN